MSAWSLAAAAYMVLSRLAYVVGVGVVLVRQDRHQVFTRERGVEEGFRRFRRGASTVMNNDGFALTVLCVVTRGSLPIDIGRGVLVAVGVLFIVVGGGVKLWARERLGVKAYYWYNFFDPQNMKPLDPPGPYRYLNNPMYTVGYLPAYGVALAFASLPGLVAAGFAQAAILVFHQVVERPHYERLMKR